MIRRLFGLLKKEELASYKEFRDNKAHFDQFKQYISFQTNLPALHAVKQNNIRKYQQEYDFKILVETGTYLGDTVEIQRHHFSQVYSIELGQDLHEKAVKRFERFPNVNLLLGDSGVVLADLLVSIDQPALFWLDGHYSSGITAKGEKNTPILEELAIILSAAHIHGILIDDARLFTGVDDYPSIDEISSFIIGKDNRRKVTVADDIIKVSMPSEP